MRAGEEDHEGLGGPAPVLVPDDASSLEPDRLAWLAEQRAVRRRRRLRRLIFTRRHERFGISGPIVAICLLLTALVGGIAVAAIPRPRQPEPAPAPLASVPLASATSVGAPSAERSTGDVLGRRLPPVTLAGDVRPVSSSHLRPGVIVLVPPDCRCAEVLTAVFRQAREFRLVMWLIGAPRPDESRTATRARLVALDEAGTAGAARWAVDPSGTLWQTLAGRGATLIAVRSDGTVAGLRRDLPLDAADLPALEPVLARLSTMNR